MLKTLFNYRTISLLILGTFITTYTEASVIADFSPDKWYANTDEHRFETSEDDALWITMDMGHSTQVPSVSNERGYDGEIGFGYIDVIDDAGDDGDYKTYIFYKNDHNDNAYSYTQGTNRMVIYVKLPEGNFTFHIGTYTRDPAISDPGSNLGPHYYHYYELQGTGNRYWTKMIMSEHPTHQVNIEVDPGNNPESWDYIEGLTRIYHEMKYSNWPGPWQPYNVEIDGIEFYKETRTENVYSINNIAATYLGAGEFNIDWRSFSQYEIHYETFEVRYSTAPINTESDYNNAQLVPGSPSGGWGQENIGHHDNDFRANFTLPSVVQGKTYYFAVKDLYLNHPKDITRISYISPETYPITEVNPIITNITITNDQN